MVQLKLGSICFLRAALSLSPIINRFGLRSVNGSVDCATCTIVLGLVENYPLFTMKVLLILLSKFVMHYQPAFQSIVKLPLSIWLNLLVVLSFLKAIDNVPLGVIVLDEFLNKETPDVICHTV